MSILKVGVLKNFDGSHSINQTQIYSGTAKSWANIQCISPIRTRDSYNISSFIDGGLGNYTFHLASHMKNSKRNVHATSTKGTVVSIDDDGVQSSSATQIAIQNKNQDLTDSSTVSLLIMGDLA